MEDTDFSKITACGGNCETCQFYQKGDCRGCIETGGERVFEGRKSVCEICACCKEKKVSFCGACPEFPCDWIDKKISEWDKEGISKLSKLRDTLFGKRLKFRELSPEWRRLFELSYLSFTEGNAPIAALLKNENNEIIAEGRNQFITGGVFRNIKMAHAEMQCLEKLNPSLTKDEHACTLYTALEPCPMCMGTIVMSGIRTVKIATRDNCGGATDICRKNDYIASKKIKLLFEDGNLGEVFITLNAYNMMQQKGKDNWVVKLFAKDYPRGAAAAIRMFETKEIERMGNNVSAEEAFAYVMDQILM